MNPVLDAPVNAAVDSPCTCYGSQGHPVVRCSECAQSALRCRPVCATLEYQHAAFETK